MNSYWRLEIDPAEMVIGESNTLSIDKHMRKPDSDYHEDVIIKLVFPKNMADSVSISAAVIRDCHEYSVRLTNAISGQFLKCALMRVVKELNRISSVTHVILTIKGVDEKEVLPSA